MNRLKNIIENKRLNDYYLIGEIAYNHEGDDKFAEETVKQLCELDVHAVKLHMLMDTDEYIVESHYDYKLRKDWNWNWDVYERIFKHIKESGKDIIALADDSECLDWLLKRDDITGIEIHAVCLNDKKMMDRLVNYSGVVLLGIGGIPVPELDKLISDFVERRGDENLVLMYGIQTYPTDLSMINFNKLNKLSKMFDLEIGYADHTSFDHKYNTFISSMGFTMGYRIIEKHYTHQYGVERIDYHAAIGTELMNELIDKLNVIRSCRGDGVLELNEAEQKYGQPGLMRKAVVAAENLKSGIVLAEENLTLKRTGEIKEGMFLRPEEITGMVLTKDLEENGTVYAEVLKKEEK